jgi:hypothetical protein
VQVEHPGRNFFWQKKEWHIYIYMNQFVANASIHVTQKISAIGLADQQRQMHVEGILQIGVHVFYKNQPAVLRACDIAILHVYP